MACRQSQIRDCRDTVDDRVSTTALVYARFQRSPDILSGNVAILQWTFWLLAEHFQTARQLQV